MMPLLFWTFVIWVILTATNVLVNIFSTKPLVTSVTMRKINALFGIYFIVIVVLFLEGVLY